jgi:hypothetical protein
MLPGEKALVERLKDKPFALIGINSDGDAAKVQGILKEQGISWRQAIDGTTRGPWATKWAIQGWPTLFVVDSKGVIRSIGHGEDEMVKAVETCLVEMGAMEKASEEKKEGESKGH